MAFSVVLTDGVTDVDLYYSAATGISLLDEGLKPGRPEDRSLYGGLAQDILIHSLKGRRQMPLALHVEGSSDDDLLNRINQLEHLVRKAEDFAIVGYGDEVFLEFKLSAATYTSRFAVLGCDLDVDRLMSVFVKDIQVVDWVPFVLTCKPYWESKTLFSLDNYLRTPHFLEDGNDDGLADHWTEMGTPTTTVETTIYLIGAKSQKVVTDTAGSDGINSDEVSEAETSAVAYAWIYVPSGDEVAVELYDSTGFSVKDTALYSEAGWATKIGADGNTWKRLVVSSDSLTSNNNHRLRILRRTGDASEATTYYVDQCYFEFGRTDTPIGWISCRDIENHYDSDVGDIPHVDFADIPGDVEAIIKLKVKNTSGASQDILYIFMDDAIARYQSHYEAEDLFYGTGNKTSEAGNSAGYYTYVNVSQEGPTASSFLGRIDLTPSTAEELRGEFRLLGRARDEYTWPNEGRFQYRINGYQSTVFILESGDWIVGSDEELMDFGSFKIQPDWLRGLAPCRLSIYIMGQRRPGEAAFDQHMDYFILAPLYQSIVMQARPNWIVAANEHYMVDSESEVCYLVSADETYAEFTFSYTGNIITLPPRKPLRLYFLQGTEAQDYEIDASMRVTVEFRARGIHLMGTE